MNQIQKRRDPFAQPIKQKEEKPIEEVVQEEEIEDFEQEEVVVRPVAPTKKVKKVVEEPVESEDRVKYTSTMDRKLRRSIKIICAERGLMFASFVEEACREKLRREGVL